MIEYRRITIEEIDLLTKVRIDFLSDVNQLTEEEKIPLSQAIKEYLTEALAEESFVAWIAVDGAEVAGVGGITFYKVPPNKACITGKAAYISNMFTYPAYRGKGIASKVFNLIVEEARIHGHSKVMLNATDMGKPLYEKYGFKEVKGDMVYYIQ